MTPDCPHCGAEAPYEIATRGIFKCWSCLRQFSAPGGGPMRCTKMSPDKWARIEAMWAEGKNAHQISKLIPVQYKTAWLAVKRLEAARAQA